jgi:tetratricopeptide (TPR) repeat protein
MDLDLFRPAAALHAQGRLAEAEAAYRTLLEGPEDQVGLARQLIGMARADQGDLDGALAMYDAALAGGWRTADLCFSRAEALRAMGRTADALQSYMDAAALNPEHAEAHHMAGVSLAALGRPEAAIERYERATALNPALKRAWNNLGVALEATGRLDEAVRSCEQAVALDPDYLQAHHNRGSALLKLGAVEAAIESLDRAIALNDAVPETWNMRAVALATLERHGEALQSAERALVLRPNYPEAQNTRSVALRALKLYEDALAAADAALTDRPAFLEALNSRGAALAKLNRHAEARRSYEAALRLSPDNAAILLNLGLALEALGELEAAADVLRRADALAPETPDAAYALGLIHIRQGDILEGHRLYEARWNQKGGPRLRHPRETLWLGETPLGDRRLLVHAEQGFGDVIQYCRFAARAAPPGQLIVQTPPSLKRLLSTLKGVEDLHDFDAPDPPFDVHIPMMSLPVALKLDLEGVRPAEPYLAVDPAIAARWRERLGPKARPRVGLAWSGNPLHENDHNRSMLFETLTPLFDAPIDFLSLQRAHHPRDVAVMARWPDVRRFDEDLTDFAETAALASLCDLVIAVDTSVAHLAGALGLQLLLLLPHVSDWRWMNGRTDTPWYPSATLMRQDAAGGWPGVIERVKSRVDALARTGGG